MTHVWLWGKGKDTPTAWVTPAIAGAYSFETALAYESEQAVMDCWNAAKDLHHAGYPLPTKVTVSRAKTLAKTKGCNWLVVLDSGHAPVTRFDLRAAGAV